MFIALGAISLAVWIYLLFGRGGFWRMRESSLLALALARPKTVAVVIPARDEEAVIGQALASLRAQDYPGPLHLFVVDDHSADATAALASRSATLVRAGPLPPGWTGKLWAISEGLKQAEALQPDYILLTDADIVHSPGNVAGLVARAEAGNLDLVSLMVRLQCRTLAERALIPAFIFFFFKLYPPAWISRRDRAAAGAAGGSILIRREALERIGGMAAICGELIDDCALARAVKRSGSIWLGLISTTASIRDYTTFTEIGRMISRTAFTQLRHSALLLAAMIVAMAVIYLAPPFLLFAGHPIARILGALAWLLMMAAFAPTLAFYGRSLAWAPLLPLIALFYMGATIDSALRYWTGRGGLWKGRAQDLPHKRMR